MSRSAGAASCSPLTNFGCFDIAICQMGFDSGYSQCHISSDSEVVVGYGEGCGLGQSNTPHVCDAGLACVAKDANVTCDPDFNFCCLAYCDVNNDGCTDGFVCKPFDDVAGMPPAEPSLSYLSLCVL